jgi:hypothetical protein
MTPEVCTNRTIYRLGSIALAMAVLVAAPAYAQLNGENLLGDMGVKSASQPHPGVYVGNIYYRYVTDTIKGADGKTIVLDPTGAGKQTIQAATPMVIYVTSKKVLGANYGMMAVMPFARGSLEAPGLGLSEETNVGASDAYIMPVQLGWHTNRADAVAGLAFFAPTGRYTAGASDNVGKGMWSYEVSAGTTLYLDDQRSLSIAGTAYWETHSRKDGDLQVGAMTVHDVKVGDLLTVEGGVGKAFLHGAGSLGVAYYAQWKTTPDELTVSVPLAEEGASFGKHRVWGVGPDVTIPIATKTKIISFVNVRYLWETGTRIKTQGQSLLVTSTVPVGGIKIPGR